MLRFSVLPLLCAMSLLAAGKQQCDVAAVIDGDTFAALCAGKPVRIRVSGIDAPELGQTWGPAARSFATTLLGGRVVVERVDRDQYGRTVAQVQLSDGRDLAREMVRAGFAFNYAEFSHDPELAKLEAEAKAENRGIWSFGGSERPGDFRAMKRMSAKRAAPRSARRSE